MSPSLHASLLSVFGWVLRGSFMAGILIVLILALQFLMKNKLESRWKYLLWIPVVIRLLLPSAPESSLSLYNVFSLEAIAPVFISKPKACHSGINGGKNQVPRAK